LARAEVEVERVARADVEFQRADDGAAEALLLDGDVVAARGQLRDAVVAVLVRLGVAREAGSRVGDGDGGAGDGGAVLVEDAAGQVGRRLLRGGRRYENEEKGKKRR
jgi:hypothetical protein